MQHGIRVCRTIKQTRSGSQLIHVNRKELIDKMNNQLDIFSKADELLAKGEEAVIHLEFIEAQKLFRMAYEMDPFTTNLEFYYQIVEFFKDQQSATQDLTKFLSLTWHGLSKAVEKNELKSKQMHRADSFLAQIASNTVSPEGDFVDAEQTLHWGALYIAQKKYKQAQKLLLDSLTNHSFHRADLWSYYGDACFALRQQHKSIYGYVNALLLDPQKIDFPRVLNATITDIFTKMCHQYPPAQSRALLPFQMWHGENMILPRLNDTTLEEIKKLEIKLSNSLISKEANQMHYFCLCFVLSEHYPRQFAYREKMQETNPDLFEKYMLKKRQLEMR